MFHLKFYFLVLLLDAILFGVHNRISESCNFHSCTDGRRLAETQQWFSMESGYKISLRSFPSKVTDSLKSETALFVILKASLKIANQGCIFL